METEALRSEERNNRKEQDYKIQPEIWVGKFIIWVRLFEIMKGLGYQVYQFHENSLTSPYDKCSGLQRQVH